MPNATNIFGLFEKLQSTDIAVYQNRCVVVRDRNATCTKCADACTSGCIALVGNELTVSPEKCVGCGTCATACPTGALEALHPGDAELLESALKATEAAGGEAVIACDQLLSAAEGLCDPERLVGVVCLGRVEEALLTSLVVAGATHISLVKGKCAECPCAAGLTTAEAVSATTNTLLETWNSEVRADIVEKLPSVTRLTGDKGYDYSKRQFFSGLRGSAKTAAATTTDFAVKEALGIKEEVEPKYVKVQANGTLPQFVPFRRQHLLKNLAALGEPQDVMIDTRLWGHVVIDVDACDSCQMCATFCPTGALAKVDEAGGSFGVDHAPSLCVKCHCCEDICNKDALRLSDEVFAVDIFSGAKERTEMKRPQNAPGGPHSVLNAMKGLIGIEEVYER